MSHETILAIITGAQNIAIILGIAWVFASGVRKSK